MWHPERQQYFWFDILGRRLLSRLGDRALEWSFDEHVSAAGRVDHDTLLIAGETGLYRFDIETGARERIVALEEGRADTRSNDGRADPQGGFWIGTMGKRAEPGQGAIYRFYRGRVERLFSGVTIPNAICFSPDGRRAYFADTARQCLWVQPLDREGWPEGPRAVFADLREAGLYPDGAVVDAEGGLWNAQWGAGRVARYLPDGSLDRVMAVGGVQSSCPAFGGADLDQMIVTTARQDLRDPGVADGVVYALAPGLRGQPEHRVLL